MSASVQGRHGRQLQVSRNYSDGSPTKSRTKEKLIDRSREVVPFGQGYVDDRTSLSSELVASVSQKAFTVRIKVKNGRTQDDEHYRGQAGLLRGDPLNESPPSKKQAVGEGGNPVPKHPMSRYKATPVTALHNVVSERNKDGDIEIFQNTTLTSPDYKSRTIQDWTRAGENANSLNEYKIRSGADGDDGYVGWEYGLDFDTAGEIDVEDSAFTEKDRAFELVRGDYRFKVGHKIGIVVFRDFVIKSEDTGAVPDMTDEEIEKAFGKLNSVNIYTGEITRVVDDEFSFEHNVNTFEGCSGAIVFLLDKNQDRESVLEQDEGKAIAVHVGGGNIGNGILRNFAFKIILKRNEEN